jgi:hypothetical protein
MDPQHWVLITSRQGWLKWSEMGKKMPHSVTVVSKDDTGVLQTFSQFEKKLGPSTQNIF